MSYAYCFYVTMIRARVWPGSISIIWLFDPISQGKARMDSLIGRGASFSCTSSTY